MLSNGLADLFLHGIAIARDPRNANVRGLEELRVTTIYSPWLLKICHQCRHTFREDDAVLPEPNSPERMVHEDAHIGLLCWSKRSGRPSAPTDTHTAVPNVEVRDAFLRGLQAHWQPAGDASTVLVPPRSALIGRKCPICRHTVRAGDTVVRCPCGRGCGGVLHQDPARHLTCWDSWNRGTSRVHCAFTGASFLATPGVEP